MRWLIAFGSVLILAGLVSPSSAEESPPVPPGPGTGLTAQAAPATGVEGFAAYVPQSTCNPRWRRGMRQFRDLVMATYPRTEDWGSRRNCTDDGISEHLDGRAWDWHADVDDPRQFAAATDLLNWLLATGPDGQAAYWARRLGIMYIAYNHRIWGSYRASEGWRRLANANPHTDHVHFSFSWAGAFGRTSFWDGTPAPEDYGPCRPYAGEPAPLYARGMQNRTPCPAAAPLSKTAAISGRLLWRGSRGPEVASLQRFFGLTPDGLFGAATMRSLADFQASNGLPRTGAVDTLTRRHLAAGGALSP